ncbi:MAG: hypothetical protein WCK86_02450 [Planctomycetia bacterium]
MSNSSFMSNIAVEQAANKTQISETRRSERFLIDATQRRMGVVTVQQGHMGFRWRGTLDARISAAFEMPF